MSRLTVSTTEERLAKLVQLAHRFEALRPAKSFHILKKHVKAFATGFDEDEASTIGGIVLHAFGHMPAKGESIELHGLTFKVSKANSRRLVQLQVIRAKEPAQAEEN